MTTPEIVLVDTDVYSYMLNGKSPAAAYRKHVEGKHIALSFITIGELYYGAYKRNWGPAKVNSLQDSFRSVAVVPYDEEICRRYAEIKSALEAKGERIEDNDTWIAACAVRHTIPLVSNNRSHFERIPGLVLISEARSLATIKSQTEIEI